VGKKGGSGESSKPIKGEIKSRRVKGNQGDGKAWLKPKKGKRKREKKSWRKKKEKVITIRAMNEIGKKKGKQPFKGRRGDAPWPGGGKKRRGREKKKSGGKKVIHDTGRNCRENVLLEKGRAEERRSGGKGGRV